MNKISCVTVVLSMGLGACAEGAVLPDGSLDSLLNGGGGPVVLEPDSGADSSADNTNIPGSGNTGPAGNYQGSGSTDYDAGSYNNGGSYGYDSGSGSYDYDSGSNSSYGYDSGTSSNYGYDSGTGSYGYDSGGASYGYDSGTSGYDAGGGTTCGGYADPNTAAGCTCAASDPSECQPNGCYGGYWCDTNTNKCHANPPSGC